MSILKKFIDIKEGVSLLKLAELEDMRPIREIIYEHLKDEILSGGIEDGARLIETSIADSMNISRTPVREAIRKLEADGLVLSIPRKGVIVKKFDINDVIEIYKIRQALEVLAVKEAAEHMLESEIKEARYHLDRAELHLKNLENNAFLEDNENFTNVLINASRMPRAIQLIASYREQLGRYRKITLSSDQRKSDVIKEHSEILKAVELRDSKLAERLVFEHISNALEVFKIISSGFRPSE